MKQLFITLSLTIIGYYSYAQTYSLGIQDARSTATTPSTYSQSLTPYFKSADALGLPYIGSTYYTTIGFRGWIGDNTGGKAHELAFSDDSRIYLRSGNSPSWEGWRQFVVSDENGNVAIGTADPQGYKLAINGSAIATSMKVALYGNWPDYVFQKTYHLRDLSEIKTYIDQNQHLPEMPSEQDVKENGINLGEIVKIQTKKIEELTLYLIEKDKQVNALQDRLSQQDIRIAALETALSKLTANK